MEVKEIAKNLEQINDINNLSLEELLEKYTKDEKTYIDFINSYSDYFCNNLLYQTIICSQYQKLKDFVVKGHNLYSNENTEDAEKNILLSIDKCLNQYKIKYDDEGQARFLFDDKIGATKSRKFSLFEEEIDEMHKVAKKYENHDNRKLDDFYEYYYIVSHFSNEYERQEAIHKYLSNHTLGNFCNNINYLYFVNYVLDCGLDDSKQFIQDAKDVVELSLEFDKHDLIHKYRNIDKDSYKRVAKKTLKNISKYEKKRELLLKYL